MSFIFKYEDTAETPAVRAGLERLIQKAYEDEDDKGVADLLVRLAFTYSTLDTLRQNYLDAAQVYATLAKKGN